MKIIKMIASFIQPPAQRPPEAEEPIAAVEEPHQLLQEQSLLSARNIIAAIDAAIADLPKYAAGETAEEADGPGALTMDDQTWIVERMKALQTALGSTHADEDISELDETLLNSFKATLPYFFKYGKAKDWQAALRQIKQAIDMRIGDSEQVTFAKVDLMMLHCKAKDLYYSWRILLSQQSMKELREERRRLALLEPSSSVDMEFDRNSTSIKTLETELEIYERRRAANSITLKELTEHKHLHEENRLSAGQIQQAIRKIIEKNSEMMLTLGEQAVQDTQAVEEIIAKKKSTIKTIRRQLDDSKPASATLLIDSDTEQTVLTQNDAEPEIQLAQQ